MAYHERAAVGGSESYVCADEEEEAGGCGYLHEDDRSTMFAMEDLGDDSDACRLVAEARGGDEGDEASRCEKDDVFTSSTGSTSSARSSRQVRPGEVTGNRPVMLASTAPLPISGPAAYHFRAQRAWLSLSAPQASAFYLGQSPPDGGQGQRLETADDDEEGANDAGASAAGVSHVTGHGDRQCTVSDETSFGRAADLPTRSGRRQPLPDLVPHATVSAAEAFRRRTFSESSVGVVTVRQFASVLRRISDDFEEEVRTKQTFVISSSTRHVVMTHRSKSGSDDSSNPGVVAAASNNAAEDTAPKRRSTSFLQDLKDYLRKGNPPSSL